MKWLRVVPSCPEARVRLQNGRPKPKRVPSIALARELLVLRVLLLRPHEPTIKLRCCLDVGGPRLHQPNSVPGSCTIAIESTRYWAKKDKISRATDPTEPTPSPATWVRTRSTSRENGQTKKKEGGKDFSGIEEGERRKAKRARAVGGTTKRGPKEPNGGPRGRQGSTEGWTTLETFRDTHAKCFFRSDQRIILEVSQVVSSFEVPQSICSCFGSRFFGGQSGGLVLFVSSLSLYHSRLRGQHTLALFLCPLLGQPQELRASLSDLVGRGNVSFTLNCSLQQPRHVDTERARSKSPLCVLN